MARTGITQLMRSRTSSDVSPERQQRKLEMLQPTCRPWVAVVIHRHQVEMDRRRTAEN